MNYVLQIAPLAVILFSIHIGALRGPTQTASDAQVIQAIKEFDSAWNRKDVATVERLLSDQYVYFSSEGKVTSRANTIEFLRSPQYVLQAADRSELQVHLTRDTAVVSSRWKGHGTYNDKPFTDDQRCSLVLIREGKNWKVLSEHCTQIRKMD